MFLRRFLYLKKKRNLNGEKLSEESRTHKSGYRLCLFRMSGQLVLVFVVLVSVVSGFGSQDKYIWLSNDGIGPPS
jgi:hypothetical protein